MEIDPKNLPTDAAALQQMLLRTLAELQVATAQLNTTSAELAAKERELQRVQHWLEQLLRNRYGQKRERVDENQLFMFAAQIASTGKEPPPEPKAAAVEPRPAPQGHGRQPLPKSLQRRRVVYDVPEAERHCPECHGELKHIGEDIREELEYVPASLEVIEHACQKYACSKGCTVVTTTIEPFGANLQSKTEQTVDDYGNVTQSLLYNYGNLTTPARTYTNTYLNTSNYTSRNIRNRLLTAQVTDGTNTITLVTNTYDGTALTNVANLVAHDASYGTSFTYRGNLTHAVSPGSIRNFSYDIGGNAISSNDGYGHTLSSTYSTATQYTAPDKLSPGSDNLATTLTYTQFLGVSTLTQPGATSSAQYDSYARPTQTTSPLGAVTTYTYDPNNPRLTTATTGTRIVKTTVDGLGRTVKVEVGDASNMKSVVDT